MIVRELYLERTDGVKLYRTYSDGGMKIRQDDTDYIYDEAIDVEGTEHTYTETDAPIEDTVTAEEALAALEGLV